MSDISSIYQWWTVFFIIGIVFLPLTVRVFSNFFDRGYIFAKILGIAKIRANILSLTMKTISDMLSL